MSGQERGKAAGDRVPADGRDPNRAGAGAPPPPSAINTDSRAGADTPVDARRPASRNPSSCDSRREKHGALGPVSPGRCAASLSLLFTLALVLSLGAGRRHPPPDLETPAAGVVLFDRHGAPLRIALDRDGQDNRPVALEAVSPWAQAAIVAVEDRRFHRHCGVDPIAVLRAGLQNLYAGRRISGASTVSTQVIRLAEPRPRTWRTKLIEAARALWLERRHDKSDILAAYLNRAPFGGNLVGIESAARWYFDKSAADLALGEAALLAGLPQSPARLRPDRHPANARRRMLHVLDRMRREGLVTPGQHAMAVRLPMDIRTGSRPFRAPHFADYVLANTARAGALVTTLDGDLQQGVEQIANRHAAALGSRRADRLAVVVMQVSDGAILAMTGSRDYFDDAAAGMVNGALARRSPGSALKPFIYALAIDQGAMTPETRLDDRPAGYRDIVPANFDGQFRGAVTLRDALVLSLNIPALNTVAQLGAQSVIDTLRGFGLGTIDRPAAHYGAGIAIGGAEVRLLDLVAAYACLARGGRYLPPRVMRDEPLSPARRVLSAEAAYIVSDILGGTERSHDLFGHIADAALPRAAWKTGTSSAYRDAWTIAWTPRHVIGVWVGNTDGRPTDRLTGAGAAAPIAGEILRRLDPSGAGDWFAPPAGIREVLLADGARDLHIAGVTDIRRRQTPPPPIRITQPADGAIYRLSAGLPGRPRLALQAESPAAQHYWFADGRPIGVVPSGEILHWPLQPGAWRITCADPDGNQASVRVVVE